MRPLESPYEAGFRRHMRPAHSRNETGTSAKRGRFGVARPWIDSVFLAVLCTCTY